MREEEEKKEGKGREGKGREGKGREGKGREGKGREGKGREGKGREGKGREGKGREGKGREGKGREGKGREGKGREGNDAPTETGPLPQPHAQDLFVNCVRGNPSLPHRQGRRCASGQLTWLLFVLFVDFGTPFGRANAVFLMSSSTLHDDEGLGMTTTFLEFGAADEETKMEEVSDDFLPLSYRGLGVAGSPGVLTPRLPATN